MTLHLLSVYAVEHMNRLSMKTPQELADTLSISEISVYRLIKAGRIHAVKVGHKWRIPAEEFERVLASGVPNAHEEVSR